MMFFFQIILVPTLNIYFIVPCLIIGPGRSPQDKTLRSCLVQDFVSHSHCNGHTNLLHMIVWTPYGIKYRVMKSRPSQPRNTPSPGWSQFDTDVVISSHSPPRPHRASLQAAAAGQGCCQVPSSFPPLSRPHPQIPFSLFNPNLPCLCRILCKVVEQRKMGDKENKKSFIACVVRINPSLLACSD
jgi:hypothetical protein